MNDELDKSGDEMIKALDKTIEAAQDLYDVLLVIKERNRSKQSKKKNKKSK